ncbi:MAG: hypothetical protein CBB61_005855 [Gammaproteobacteria bacterium TMED1]|nr:MAG: hypothetical protein CBB61_005855 [Gammaproteobacteria bacterium TMED1]
MQFARGSARISCSLIKCRTMKMVLKF